MRHTVNTVLAQLWAVRMSVAAGILAAALTAQDVLVRSEVSLVRVDAQITTAAGGVTGLAKADFEVRDNDQIQPILYASQEDQPLDILLLFDNSGSMQPAIRRLAASAHTALTELRKGDRVAVAYFNSDAWLISDFNDDLAEVEKTVGRVVDLRFGGFTHILAAIDRASEHFIKHADPERRHAILIFTDNMGQSSANEKKVVDHLWAQDILLCGLIVGAPGSSRGFGGGEGMIGAAVKTGGETVNADDPGHAFREMLRRIRRRYSVYYATPAGKPGTARKVALDLSATARNRYPDAQVLARKGYVIPKPASSPSSRAK